jgi:molecular chaperone HtpG
LDLLKNGAFDEKIENYSVKVQEIENYMDDGSKKKEESDVEKIDEEKETKSKKKKLKEGSHGWRFHSK